MKAIKNLQLPPSETLKEIPVTRASKRLISNLKDVDDKENIPSLANKLPDKGTITKKTITKRSAQETKTKSENVVNPPNLKKRKSDTVLQEIDVNNNSSNLSVKNKSNDNSLETASEPTIEKIQGIVSVIVPVESQIDDLQAIQPRRRTRQRKSNESESSNDNSFNDTSVLMDENFKDTKSSRKPRKSNSTKTANEASISIIGQVSILPCAIEEPQNQLDSVSNELAPIVETAPIETIQALIPIFADSVTEDPVNCSNIVNRMYQNFYEIEKQYAANPYLDRQKDINPKMRAILVDWLIEVHYKFKFQPPTLWLCINILDRYLEIAQTSRSDLQLVGVASLLIACKFEEIRPPEVRDCVYITDYAYSREQVLNMESKILKQLDYQLCIPTGFHFMTRYLNFLNASDQLRYLSFYYAERNLQEYDMLNIPPHQFVAASLFAALNFRDKDLSEKTHSLWTLELTELTGYSEAEVFPYSVTILQHVQEETVTASRRQLIAAKKKYAAEKYNSISSLPVPVLSNEKR